MEIEMRNNNMTNPINEYCTAKGLKKTSQQSITYMLQHYERFQHTTLTDLLEEAEEEEDAGIRWKYRRLKGRRSYICRSRRQY